MSWKLQENDLFFAGLKKSQKVAYNTQKINW